MEAKDLIEGIIEKVQKNANVKAVFGDPVEQGKVMVIPVASVSIYGGGGGGIDNRSVQDESENGNAQGIGMGLKVKTSPVGYIEITEEGAIFVEIFQQSKMIMSGMALGAFALFSLTRLIKKMIKKD